MKLIGLEDLKNYFRVVKIENDFAYLKLKYGRYILKVKLPFETNKKLASLLGHILGDGCIKSKEENVYYTNKSKELIEEVKIIIKELFGIDAKENFNREREFYELYPPKIVAKFLVLCGFPKGEKTKQELYIPDWVKNGSDEIKSAFIRSLFDDDSSVINSKRNCVISFGLNKMKSLANSHRAFMEDIRQILLSLGLYPNEIFARKQPGDFIQLGFHMYGRYNLIKFLEKIGFTHKGKQQNLIKAIDSYNSYGKNEAKRRILDALRINGRLTTRDLRKIINRDGDVIWKNVNKLVKEGYVEKILISKRGPVEKVLWELKNNINNNNKVN